MHVLLLCGHLMIHDCLMKRFVVVVVIVIVCEMSVF